MSPFRITAITLAFTISSQRPAAASAPAALDKGHSHISAIQILDSDLAPSPARYGPSLGPRYHWKPIINLAALKLRLDEYLSG